MHCSDFYFGAAACLYWGFYTQQELAGTQDKTGLGLFAKGDLGAGLMRDDGEP